MSIKIGTCSWNYDSWLSLVYTEKQKHAAAYLREYSAKYDIAEIDSWFYKIPARAEAESYLAEVPDDFGFTCKMTNAVSLTHLRGKEPSINPDFLSVDLFMRYIDAVEPMLSRLDGIMLEFEYLNRSKMSGVSEFIDRLGSFFTKVPPGLPLAVETRNKNYLTEDYFKMLSSLGVMHVFSEKLYMPPVTELWRRFGRQLTGSTIIRLLGGDRKEIEKITASKWDKVVLPKPELSDISGMIRSMDTSGMKVTVCVNNHYEGSAPRTIERLKRELLQLK